MGGAEQAIPIIGAEDGEDGFRYVLSCARETKKGYSLNVSYVDG